MDSSEAAAFVPTDEESAQWVAGLAARGSEREAAADRLHALMLRACRSELSRRSSASSLPRHDFDIVAAEAAGDATLAVLGRLHAFRGESRFTTWAYAFAVFAVSHALGRRRRVPDESALTEQMWAALPDRLGTAPDEQAAAKELLGVLRMAVEESLTQRQREMFVAIVVQGVPVDALAVQLGTSRGAIYKTVFDARRKIRAFLVLHGFIETGTEGRP